MKPKNIAQWFAADHAVPKSRGGSDDLDNLIPACWICNCGKGGKTVEEYRSALEMQSINAPYFTAKQLAWLESVGFEMPKAEPHVFWGEAEGEVDHGQ